MHSHYNRFGLIHASTRLLMHDSCLCCEGRAFHHFTKVEPSKNTSLPSSPFLSHSLICSSSATTLFSASLKEPFSFRRSSTSAQKQEPEIVSSGLPPACSNHLCVYLKNVG